MSLTRKLAKRASEVSPYRRATAVEAAEARKTIVVMQNGNRSLTREQWQSIETRARAEGVTEEELAAIRPPRFTASSLTGFGPDG